MIDAIPQKPSIFLRPVLQVGHLVATVSVILAVFAWKAEIDTQTRVNELRIYDIQMSLRQNRQETMRALNEVKDSLRRIEE